MTRPFYLKIVATVLSLSLVLTSGGVVDAALAAPEVFVGPSSLPQFSLQPPRQYGRIADYFNADTRVGAGPRARPQSGSNPIESNSHFGQTQGSAPTRPLVILIQDLHAHYGVQKNIAGLLDFLTDKLRADTRPAPTVPFALAVEGASGPIDSSVLALFPDEKVKLAASDYLMREAELTGAEYFAIKRGLPKFLVGAENEKYYTVHRDLFRKTLTDRNELVKSLKAIQHDVNQLPRYVFRKNKALWEFHQKTEAYAQVEMSTHEFIRLLVQTADQLKSDLPNSGASKTADPQYGSSAARKIRSSVAPPLINLKRDFPTLASFASNSRYGTMDQIRAATALFLTQIQRHLSAQEKADLKVLAKNNGTTTYYLYLRELIYKKQLFLAAPPELAQYLEYIHIAQTMGMDRVIHEAKELAFRIKLGLARDQRVGADPRVRPQSGTNSISSNSNFGQAQGPAPTREPSNPALDLVQVQHDLDLLLRLSDLQATEHEVRDFAPRLNQFVALTKTLLKADQPTTELPNSGPTKTADIKFDESKIRRLISSSIDFYVMALVRNKPMVENTLKLIGLPSDSSAVGKLRRTIGPTLGSSDVAVLIAGGFHTAQLTSLLREKNVSYVVMAPHVENLTDADHELYVKRLKGDLLTEEEIFAAAKDKHSTLYQVARANGAKGQPFALAKLWPFHKNQQNTLSSGVPMGSNAIFWTSIIAIGALMYGMDIGDYLQKLQSMPQLHSVAFGMSLATLLQKLIKPSTIENTQEASPSENWVYYYLGPADERILFRAVPKNDGSSYWRAQKLIGETWKYANDTLWDLIVNYHKKNGIPDPAVVAGFADLAVSKPSATANDSMAHVVKGAAALLVVGIGLSAILWAAWQAPVSLNASQFNLDGLQQLAAGLGIVGVFGLKEAKEPRRSGIFYSVVIHGVIIGALIWGSQLFSEMPKPNFSNASLRKNSVTLNLRNKPVQPAVKPSVKQDLPIDAPIDMPKPETVPTLQEEAQQPTFVAQVVIQPEPQPQLQLHTSMSDTKEERLPPIEITMTGTGIEGGTLNSSETSDLVAWVSEMNANRPPNQRIRFVNVRRQIVEFSFVNGTLTLDEKSARSAIREKDSLGEFSDLIRGLIDRTNSGRAANGFLQALTLVLSGFFQWKWIRGSRSAPNSSDGNNLEGFFTGPWQAYIKAGFGQDTNELKEAGQRMISAATGIDNELADLVRFIVNARSRITADNVQEVYRRWDEFAASYLWPRGYFGLIDPIRNPYKGNNKEHYDSVIYKLDSSIRQTTVYGNEVILASGRPLYRSPMKHPAFFRGGVLMVDSGYIEAETQRAVSQFSGFSPDQIKAMIRRQEEIDALLYRYAEDLVSVDRLSVNHDLEVFLHAAGLQGDQATFVRQTVAVMAFNLFLSRNRPFALSAASRMLATEYAAQYFAVRFLFGYLTGQDPRDVASDTIAQQQRTTPIDPKPHILTGQRLFSEANKVAPTDLDDRLKSIVEPWVGDTRKLHLLTVALDAAEPVTPLTFFTTRWFGQRAATKRALKLKKVFDTNASRPEWNEFKKDGYNATMTKQEREYRYLWAPDTLILSPEEGVNLWIQEYFAPRFEAPLFYFKTIGLIFATLHVISAPFDALPTLWRGAADIFQAYKNAHDKADAEGVAGPRSVRSATSSHRRAQIASVKAHRDYNEKHRFDRKALAFDPSAMHGSARNIPALTIQIGLDDPNSLAQELGSIIRSGEPRRHSEIKGITIYVYTPSSQSESRILGDLVDNSLYIPDSRYTESQIQEAAMQLQIWQENAVEFLDKYPEAWNDLRREQRNETLQALRRAPAELRDYWKAEVPHNAALRWQGLQRENEITEFTAMPDFPYEPQSITEEMTGLANAMQNLFRPGMASHARALDTGDVNALRKKALAMALGTQRLVNLFRRHPQFFELYFDRTEVPLTSFDDVLSTLGEENWQHKFTEAFAKMGAEDSRNDRQLEVRRAVSHVLTQVAEETNIPITIQDEAAITKRARQLIETNDDRQEGRLTTAGSSFGAPFVGETWILLHRPAGSISKKDEDVYYRLRAEMDGRLILQRFEGKLEHRGQEAVALAPGQTYPIAEGIVVSATPRGQSLYDTFTVMALPTSEIGTGHSFVSGGKVIVSWNQPLDPKNVRTNPSDTQPPAALTHPDTYRAGAVRLIGGKELYKQWQKAKTDAERDAILREIGLNPTQDIKDQLTPDQQEWIRNWFSPWSWLEIWNLATRPFAFAGEHPDDWKGQTPLRMRGAAQVFFATWMSAVMMAALLVWAGWMTGDLSQTLTTLRPVLATLGGLIGFIAGFFGGNITMHTLWNRKYPGAELTVAKPAKDLERPIRRFYESLMELRKAEAFVADPDQSASHSNAYEAGERAFKEALSAWFDYASGSGIVDDVDRERGHSPSLSDRFSSLLRFFHGVQTPSQHFPGSFLSKFDIPAMTKDTLAEVSKEIAALQDFKPLHGRGTGSAEKHQILAHMLSSLLIELGFGDPLSRFEAIDVSLGKTVAPKPTSLILKKLTRTAAQGITKRIVGKDELVARAELMEFMDILNSDFGKGLRESYDMIPEVMEVLFQLAADPNSARARLDTLRNNLIKTEELLTSIEKLAPYCQGNGELQNFLAPQILLIADRAPYESEVNRARMHSAIGPLLPLSVSATLRKPLEKAVMAYRARMRPPRSVLTHPDTYRAGAIKLLGEKFNPQVPVKDQLTEDQMEWIRTRFAPWTWLEIWNLATRPFAFAGEHPEDWKGQTPLRMRGAAQVFFATWMSAVMMAALLVWAGWMTGDLSQTLTTLRPVLATIGGLVGFIAGFFGGNITMHTLWNRKHPGAELTAGDRTPNYEAIMKGSWKNGLQDYFGRMDVPSVEMSSEAREDILNALMADNDYAETVKAHVHAAMRQYESDAEAIWNKGLEDHFKDKPSRELKLTPQSRSDIVAAILEKQDASKLAEQLIRKRLAYESAHDIPSEPVATPPEGNPLVIAESAHNVIQHGELRKIVDRWNLDIHDPTSKTGAAVAQYKGPDSKWQRVIDFIHRLATAIGLRGPIVYYPFGGFDPFHPFTLVPTATDVVSMGTEPFGPAEDITRFVERSGAIEKAGNGSPYYDSIRDMHFVALEYRLEGLGAMAMARIMAHLDGNIVGLYYFRLDSRGAIHFATEQDLANDVYSFPHAVIEFVNPATKQKQRYWYFQETVENPSYGYQQFTKYFTFQTLFLKAAPPGLFEEAEIRKNSIRLALMPAKRVNASVITDGRIFKIGQGDAASASMQYPIWQPNSNLHEIALENGQSFGYSTGPDGKVFYGSAENLIDPETPVGTIQGYFGPADQSFALPQEVFSRAVFAPLQLVRKNTPNVYLLLEDPSVSLRRLVSTNVSIQQRKRFTGFEISPLFVSNYGFEKNILDSRTIDLTQLTQKAPETNQTKVLLIVLLLFVHAAVAFVLRDLSPLYALSAVVLSLIGSIYLIVDTAWKQYGNWRTRQRFKRLYALVSKPKFDNNSSQNERWSRLFDDSLRQGIEKTARDLRVRYEVLLKRFTDEGRKKLGELEDWQRGSLRTLERAQGYAYPEPEGGPDRVFYRFVSEKQLRRLLEEGAIIPRALRPGFQDKSFESLMENGGAFNLLAKQKTYNFDTRYLTSLTGDKSFAESEAKKENGLILRIVLSSKRAYSTKQFLVGDERLAHEDEYVVPGIISLSEIANLDEARETLNDAARPPVDNGAAPASLLYWFLLMGQKLGWWPNMEESTIQKWGMRWQGVEMAAFGWIPFLITGEPAGIGITALVAGLHYPLMLMIGHRPREGLIGTLGPLVLLGYSLPALLGLPVLPTLIIVSVLHTAIDFVAIFGTPTWLRRSTHTWTTIFNFYRSAKLISSPGALSLFALSFVLDDWLIPMTMVNPFVVIGPIVSISLSFLPPKVFKRIQRLTRLVSRDRDDVNLAAGPPKPSSGLRRRDFLGQLMGLVLHGKQLPAVAMEMAQAITSVSPSQPSQQLIIRTPLGKLAAKEFADQFPAGLAGLLKTFEGIWTPEDISPIQGLLTSLGKTPLTSIPVSEWEEHVINLLSDSAGVFDGLELLNVPEIGGFEMMGRLSENQEFVSAMGSLEKHPALAPLFSENRTWAEQAAFEALHESLTDRVMHLEGLMPETEASSLIQDYLTPEKLARYIPDIKRRFNRDRFFGRLMKEQSSEKSRSKVSHDQVNRYIRKHLPLDLRNDRTQLSKFPEATYKDVRAHVIPIKGLFRNTGQLGHIGLGRAYGTPVIYIDAAYQTNHRVLNHELFEIGKWEQLRRKLGLSPARMRTWIRQNLERAHILADYWHYKAPSVDHLLDEAAARTHIQTLPDAYNSDGDLNLASGPPDATRPQAIIHANAHTPAQGLIPITLNADILKVAAIADSLGLPIMFMGGTARRMVLGSDPTNGISDIDLAVDIPKQSALNRDATERMQRLTVIFQAALTKQLPHLDVDIMNINKDNKFLDSPYGQVERYRGATVDRLFIRRQNRRWVVTGGTNGDYVKDILGKVPRLMAKTPDTELSFEGVLRLTRLLAEYPDFHAKYTGSAAQAEVNDLILKGTLTQLSAFPVPGLLDALNVLDTELLSRNMVPPAKSLLKIFIHAQNPSAVPALLRQMGSPAQNLASIYESTLDFDAIIRIVQESRQTHRTLKMSDFDEAFKSRSLKESDLTRRYANASEILPFVVRQLAVNGIRDMDERDLLDFMEAEQGDPLRSSNDKFIGERALWRYTRPVYYSNSIFRRQLNDETMNYLKDCVTDAFYDHVVKNKETITAEIRTGTYRHLLDYYAKHYRTMAAATAGQSQANITNMILAAGLGTLVAASNAKATVQVDPQVPADLRTALEQSILAAQVMMTWPINSDDSDVQQLAAKARDMFNNPEKRITVVVVRDLTDGIRSLNLKSKDAYMNDPTISGGNARAMLQKLSDSEYRLIFDLKTLQDGLAAVITGLLHEAIAHTVVDENHPGLSPLEEEALTFRLEIKYFETLLADRALLSRFGNFAAYFEQEFRQYLESEKEVLRFLEDEISKNKATPAWVLPAVGVAGVAAAVAGGLGIRTLIGRRTARRQAARHEVEIAFDRARSPGAFRRLDTPIQRAFIERHWKGQDFKDAFLKSAGLKTKHERDTFRQLLDEGGAQASLGAVIAEAFGASQNVVRSIGIPWLAGEMAMGIFGMASLGDLNAQLLWAAGYGLLHTIIILSTRIRRGLPLKANAILRAFVPVLILPLYALYPLTPAIAGLSLIPVFAVVVLLFGHIFWDLYEMGFQWTPSEVMVYFLATILAAMSLIVRNSHYRDDSPPSVPSAPVKTVVSKETAPAPPLEQTSSEAAFAEIRSYLSGLADRLEKSDGSYYREQGQQLRKWLPKLEFSEAYGSFFSATLSRNRSTGEFLVGASQNPRFFVHRNFYDLVLALKKIPQSPADEASRIRNQSDQIALALFTALRNKIKDAEKNKHLGESEKLLRTKIEQAIQRYGGPSNIPATALRDYDAFNPDSIFGEMVQRYLTVFAQAEKDNIYKSTTLNIDSVNSALAYLQRFNSPGIKLLISVTQLFPDELADKEKSRRQSQRGFGVSFFNLFQTLGFGEREQWSALEAVQRMSRRQPTLYGGEPIASFVLQMRDLGEIIEANEGRSLRERDSLMEYLSDTNDEDLKPDSLRDEFAAPARAETKKDRDYGIRGDGSRGLVSRQKHDEDNAEIAKVLSDVAGDLGIAPDADGWYDFRGLVQDARFTRQNPYEKGSTKIWIEEDGILVIQDTRFKKADEDISHAGRNAWAVYASGPEKTTHELNELRRQAAWAIKNKVATPMDIVAARLGDRIHGALNFPEDNAERIAKIFDGFHDESVGMEEHPHRLQTLHQMLGQNWNLPPFRKALYFQDGPRPIDGIERLTNSYIVTEVHPSRSAGHKMVLLWRSRFPDLGLMYQIWEDSKLKAHERAFKPSAGPSYRTQGTTWDYLIHGQDAARPPSPLSVPSLGEHKPWLSFEFYRDVYQWGSLYIALRLAQADSFNLTWVLDDQLGTRLSTLMASLDAKAWGNTSAVLDQIERMGVRNIPFWVLPKSSQTRILGIRLWQKQTYLDAPADLSQKIENIFKDISDGTMNKSLVPSLALEDMESILHHSPVSRGALRGEPMDLARITDKLPRDSRTFRQLHQAGQNARSLQAMAQVMGLETSVVNRSFVPDWLMKVFAMFPVFASISYRYRTLIVSKPTTPSAVSTPEVRPELSAHELLASFLNPSPEGRLLAAFYYFSNSPTWEFEKLQEAWHASTVSVTLAMVVRWQFSQAEPALEEKGEALLAALMLSPEEKIEFKEAWKSLRSPETQHMLDRFLKTAPAPATVASPNNFIYRVMRLASALQGRSVQNINRDVTAGKVALGPEVAGIIILASSSWPMKIGNAASNLIGGFDMGSATAFVGMFIAIVGFVLIFHTLLLIAEQRARGEPLNWKAIGRDTTKQILHFLPYLLMTVHSTNSATDLVFFMVGAALGIIFHMRYDVNEFERDRASNGITLLGHTHGPQADVAKSMIEIISRAHSTEADVNALFEESKPLIQSLREDTALLKSILLEQKNRHPKIGLEMSTEEVKDTIRQADAAFISYPLMMRNFGMSNPEESADDLILLLFGPAIFLICKYPALQSLKEDLVGLENNDYRKQTQTLIDHIKSTSTDLKTAISQDLAGNNDGYAHFAMQEAQGILDNAIKQLFKEKRKLSDSSIDMIANNFKNPSTSALARQLLLSWIALRKVNDERDAAIVQAIGDISQNSPLIVVIGALHVSSILQAFPDKLRNVTRPKSTRIGGTDEASDSPPHLQSLRLRLRAMLPDLAWSDKLLQELMDNHELRTTDQVDKWLRKNDLSVKGERSKLLLLAVQREIIRQKYVELAEKGGQVNQEIFTYTFWSDLLKDSGFTDMHFFIHKAIEGGITEPLMKARSSAREFRKTDAKQLFMYALNYLDAQESITQLRATSATSPRERKFKLLRLIEAQLNLFADRPDTFDHAHSIKYWKEFLGDNYQEDLIDDILDRVTESELKRKWEVGPDSMSKYVEYAIYVVRVEMHRTRWQQMLKSAQLLPRETEADAKIRAIRIVEAQLHLIWHEAEMPAGIEGGTYWRPLIGDPEDFNLITPQLQTAFTAGSVGAQEAIQSEHKRGRIFDHGFEGVDTKGYAQAALLALGVSAELPKRGTASTAPGYALRDGGILVSMGVLAIYGFLKAALSSTILLQLFLSATPYLAPLLMMMAMTWALWDFIGQPAVARVETRMDRPKLLRRIGDGIEAMKRAGPITAANVIHDDIIPTTPDIHHTTEALVSPRSNPFGYSA